MRQDGSPSYGVIETFEDVRISIITVVAWFYEGERGSSGIGLQAETMTVSAMNECGTQQSQVITISCIILLRESGQRIHSSRRDDNKY